MIDICEIPFLCMLFLPNLFLIWIPLALTILPFLCLLFHNKGCTIKASLNSDKVGVCVSRWKLHTWRTMLDAYCLKEASLEPLMQLKLCPHKKYFLALVFSMSWWWYGLKGNKPLKWPACCCFFFLHQVQKAFIFLAVFKEITRKNPKFMPLRRTALVIYSFISNTTCIPWENKWGSSDGTDFPGLLYTA